MGLRNILRIPAAYMSRISNNQVMDIANHVLYGEQHNNRYLIASNMIKMRAVGFLGHIARESPSWSHVARVTVDADFAKFEYGHKRVGRPRYSWMNMTMEKAHRLWYKKANKKPPKFDIRKKEHR